MKKTAVAVVPEFANGATEAQVDEYNRNANPSGYYGGAKFDLKKPMPRGQNRPIGKLPSNVLFRTSNLYQPLVRINGGAQQSAENDLNFMSDVTKLEFRHETGAFAQIRIKKNGEENYTNFGSIPSGTWAELPLPSAEDYSTIFIFTFSE